MAVSARVWAAAVLLGGLALAGCTAGSGGSTGTGAGFAAQRPAPAAQQRAATAPAAHATSAGATRPAGVAAPKSPPPRPTPCAKNRRTQHVFVSIRRQHLWMCARHRVAYSTGVTTGMVGQYTATPTGTFHIQGLNRNSVLTLNTGQTYPVKYWIPFQAPLFGFHDSSWQKFAYGSPKYKTAGSHGCVHMPLKAIRFLYHWASIGTAVTIH